MRIPAYRNALGQVVQFATPNEVINFASRLLATLTTETLDRVAHVIRIGAEFGERMTIRACLEKMRSFPTSEYAFCGSSRPFVVEHDEDGGGEINATDEPGKHILEAFLGYTSAKLETR